MTAVAAAPTRGHVKVAEDRPQEPEAERPPKTLHQRIADVAREVGRVEPSGTNAFKKPAISIYDVENAIREPLARAGVITRWSYGDLSPIEGGLWLARLTVTLVSEDDCDDVIEAEWADIGNTPMGATSFARKGFYKALFHLAEEEDDHLPQREHQVGSTDRGSSRPAAPGRTVLEGHACPVCADQLVLVPHKNGSFVGHQTYPTDCRWKPSNEVAAQMRREAENAEDAAAEPDWKGLLARLSEDTQREIYRDPRFARQPDESVVAWTVRLNRSQKYELKKVIDRAMAEAAPEIPFA